MDASLNYPINPILIVDDEKNDNLFLLTRFQKYYISGSNKFQDSCQFSSCVFFFV